MERRRRTNIAIATGIGFLGCFGSLVGAATLLHSDDGMHVLAGLFYGVPIACFAAGWVAGSRSDHHPSWDGLVAAELAWALTCVALVAAFRSPAFAGVAFLAGEIGIVPVWLFGLLGGWAGGALANVVRHLAAGAREPDG